MTIALVGSVGAIATGTATVSPAYAQNTTLGNWVGAVVNAVVTSAISTTATGWTQAETSTSSTNTQTSIWYRESVGAAEAAPTFTAASGAMTAYLFEFFGVQTSSSIDKIGANALASQPVTATTSAPDSAATDLVIVSTMGRAAASFTTTFSHNAGYNDLANDGATNQTTHIDGAYQVLTAGGVTADTDTVGLTNSPGRVAVSIASFKAANISAAVAKVYAPPPRKRRSYRGFVEFFKGPVNKVPIPPKVVSTPHRARRGQVQIFRGPINPVPVARVQVISTHRPRFGKRLFVKGTTLQPIIPVHVTVVTPTHVRRRGVAKYFKGPINKVPVPPIKVVTTRPPRRRRGFLLFLKGLVVTPPAPRPPISFTAGRPTSYWAAGEPSVMWNAGLPVLLNVTVWSAGEPSITWNAGLPTTDQSIPPTWEAGVPRT